MTSLEDAAGGLSLAVDPARGELVGLRARRAGRWIELIHAAAEGWRGGAPWLFPAVGRSAHDGKPGAYALGGRVYAMPLHGFSMERPWTLLRADAKEIVCRLADDEKTRGRYPFGFTLTVGYALAGRGVRAEARIEASSRNEAPMPFCIGNHTTLAVADPARCVVRSPAKEILELRPDGFLSGKTRPADYAGGKTLAHDPALRDLVLSGFGSECWTEVELSEDVTVRVTQPASENARFVFYSDGKSFFCPEPWLGEPDSLNSGRALSHLAPGERFSWALELEVR